MTESTKIFEFSIAHVKPKYLIQCLQEIPVGKKLWEKYGGKYHGTWLTEAGASCQIFALLEWGSLDQRGEMTVKGFEDPDILAHLATMGRYINRAEDYICRSEHFQEPFSATEAIWVDRVKPNKSDHIVVADLKRIADTFGKEFSNHIFLNTILVPLVYTDHCIWSIWQVKGENKLDKIFSTSIALETNPSNWTQIDEFRNNFEIQSAVIARPIDKLLKK